MDGVVIQVIVWELRHAESCGCAPEQDKSVVVGFLFFDNSRHDVVIKHKKTKYKSCYTNPLSILIYLTYPTEVSTN